MCYTHNSSTKSTVSRIYIFSTRRMIGLDARAEFFNYSIYKVIKNQWIYEYNRYIFSTINKKKEI